LGRKIASILLLIAFCVSAWTLFTREPKVLRETINSAQNEYRVKLEDFTVTNYEDGQVTEKMSAKLGVFVEPNIIELSGDVLGERTPEEKQQVSDITKKEMIRSDHATIYLRATSLNMLLSQTAELDRSELTGHVQVGFKDHTLTTDYAEYLQDQKVIQSPKKVKVLGPNRSFEGEEGFVYSLDQEILEIKGIVKGVTTLEN
jgi:LPS export ABC transporter protein LptC